MKKPELSAIEIGVGFDYTMNRFVTALCVLLTIFQGGFSDMAWALCGILAAIYILLRAKKRLPTPVILLMAAYITVYCTSVLYHGLTYEALAAVGRVAVSFLLLFLFVNMKTDVHGTVFITGMVVAIIGFAAFCGVLNWEAAVLTGRLQSVFQYANAAGLFLGVSAFLTRRHEKWFPYALFIETALLLTQSVGALAVYAVGWMIFLFIHRRTIRVTQLFCGFAVSFVFAGMTFLFARVFPFPQLGLLPPVILLFFRNKIHEGIDSVARRKGILYAAGGLGFAAVGVLFALRGLNPLLTYIDRLVQVSDGFRLIARYPLGIGPGVWQFHFPAYQTAHFYASKIHSEIVSAGVDAGFVVIVLSLLFLAYWLKHQCWNEKSICLGMILLHSALDISFSFISIVFVTAMLFADTLPPPKAMPPPFRAIALLPLALCVIMLITATMKNRAEHFVLAGNDLEAAALLDNRPMLRDTEAILTQLYVYAALELHDEFDRVFEDLIHPDAVAHFQKARSLMLRGRFEEAAEHALDCKRESIYSPLGNDLLEQIIPNLDPVSQADFRERMQELTESVAENPLFTYKRKLMGEQ